MKFIATFLLGTIVLCASAQDKFAPGFYLNQTGDTIRGLIQYQHNYGSGFIFRPELKSKSQLFTPATIKSFGFAKGKVFESISISIKNGRKDQVFVNVLLTGEVELYSYQRQYIIGSDSKGHFNLIKRKSTNDAEALRNYQANTGTFNILFQDCPAVKENAQKTFITESKLLALLKAYHECRNLSYKEIKPAPTAPTRRVNSIGFFAGQAFSSLSFDDPDVFENSSYLSNANFGTSSNVTFGVMALIGSRHPSSVVALETGLAYTSGSFDGTFVYTKYDVGGYDIKQTSVTSLEYKRLSINCGIRLTARGNKFHPYMSFGVAGQPFISMKSNVNQTTIINDSEEVENFKLNTGSASFSLWASAGLKMDLSSGHGIFIDLNYDAASVGSRGTLTTFAPRMGFLF